MKQAYAAAAVFILTNVILTCVLAQAQGDEWQQRREKVRAIVADTVENTKRKIEFFGKVVDQNGSPVADAAVNAHFTSLVDPAGMGEAFERHDEKLTTRSDANGLFQFQGQGYLLTLDLIEKHGYRPSRPPSPRSFNFNPNSNARVHQPEPSAPVNYVMWKKQGAAHLIQWNAYTHIPQDGGSAVIVDVVNCTAKRVDPLLPNPRVYGLKIVLRTRIPPGVTACTKYSWLTTIEAIGGGVRTSEDQYLFLAPESGYAPSVDITVSPIDKDWSSSRIISFYYKSSDDKVFGRFKFEITSFSTRVKAISGSISL